jgi:putative acetyltransferase
MGTSYEATSVSRRYCVGIASLRETGGAMSATMDIRQAGPGDEAYCAQIVHGWIAQTEWIPKLFTEAELAVMIAEAMPRRVIWLGGEPPEGYLSLDPETGRIGAIYCARRGAGLGKALVDRAKEGRNYLQLWTHESNTDAHRFYRREGFVIVGRNAEGDDGLPELLMEWRR